MTLEQHVELQKAELMEPTTKRWTGNEYENRREELYARLTPIVMWEDHENFFDVIKTARMKKREELYASFTCEVLLASYRMEERWTEDEISVHGEELYAPWRKMSDERRKERGANNISAFAEQTNDNFSDYSSKLKRGTFALCSQFLPCVGGNDLEDSHHTQQTINGIYQHTLRIVSHCPSVSDYIQRGTDKCAEVCTNNIQDDGCSYHCMRDSYKTSLVEFCAKPKFLFSFCPEYDPIGRTIQHDYYTPCNSSESSQIFYRSSDLFFCDQGNCLQLHDTTVTGLITEATPVSGNINDMIWPIVLLFILLLLSAVLLVIRVRKAVARNRKLAKNQYPVYGKEMKENDSFSITFE